MIRTKSSSLQDRCRLVSLLTELSENKLSVADYNMAERLGHLVGVSGSMVLARGLRGLPTQPNQNRLATGVNVQKVLFSERERVIHSIIDSFSLANGDAPTRVPSLASGVRAEALRTFEPYQRFYVTHQVELSVAVKELRTKVRAYVSTASCELHQLCVLDQTLDESLEVHTRKLFSVVPKLLELRFKKLLANANQALEDDAVDQQVWVQPLHQDMCELLLAEFDVRLQPVFGLLEAFNEHIETSS